MPSLPQTMGSPRAHVAQLAARRPAVLDDDHRVHPLPPDLDPAAVVPDDGAVIGGGVEVLGRAAVLVGGGAPSRRSPPADGSRARAAPRAATTAPRLVGRRDLQSQPRVVLVGAADVEAEDLEGAVVADDGVEDRGQDPRVDEVTLGLENGLYVHAAIVSALLSLAAPTSGGRRDVPASPRRTFRDRWR